MMYVWTWFWKGTGIHRFSNPYLLSGILQAKQLPVSERHERIQGSAYGVPGLDIPVYKDLARHFNRGTCYINYTLKEEVKREFCDFVAWCVITVIQQSANCHNSKAFNHKGLKGTDDRIDSFLFFWKDIEECKAEVRIYVPAYMESIKLSQLSPAGRTMLCLKRSMGWQCRIAIVSVISFRSS